MKTILQELGKFFVKTNIGRVAIKENIENLTSYENLGVNHHMGGTRVGEDPTTSVVNKNLKVHLQITCLYVVVQHSQQVFWFKSNLHNSKKNS